MSKQEKKKSMEKDESMNRMMKDMSMDKKKSEGKEGKEGKVDSALEKYLDPNQGEESDDSDQGEIIDASQSLPSLSSSLLPLFLSSLLTDESAFVWYLGARTGYYDLPSTKPKRGTQPGQIPGGQQQGSTVRGDDGTVWPAPWAS